MTAFVREHETEPLLGLPERLPQGERLLWQGTPQTRLMARYVFHFHKICLWFSVIALWRLLANKQATGSWSVDLLHTPVLALTLALVIVSLLAWLYSRSTIYTLTNRRIVMRFGLAVPITMNLPFSQIISADAAQRGSADSGNIAFSVSADARVSHWILWPNARPWHWFSAQPMLCCIADLEKVSALLSEALAESANDAKESAVALNSPVPHNSDAPRNPDVQLTDPVGVTQMQEA